MPRPSIQPLPALMVAPNGARRTKDDHPAIPITLDEIIADAKACHAAGADGLHLHLRDKDGKHILDAGLYHEACAELAQQIPDMAVQITTEAMGQYEPGRQREIAFNSGCPLVSMSIRENAADAVWDDNVGTDAAKFYRECDEQGIAIQHILYNAGDFELLHQVLPSTLFCDPRLQLLFVLGRYDQASAASSGTTGDKDGKAYDPASNSRPAMITPFIYKLADFDIEPDWMACAFGPGETRTLKAAQERGGKLRVGFENSIWHADGSVAESNAARVHAVTECNEPTTSA